jgi:hypothetical protein
VLDALSVDAVMVVAAIKGAGLGVESASTHRVKQRRDEQRLVPAGRLYLPRERQARCGADSGVDAVSVDPPPLRVEIAEPCPHEASGSLYRFRSGPWL